MAAYLGPAQRASRLFDQSPHGLVPQSWRPREMVSGTVNADGFGLGWYPSDADPRPALYRSLLPAWADPNLEALGRVAESGLIFGAVRGATIPGSTAYADTPPFQAGPLLFMHNGFIEGFHQGPMRALRAQLDDAVYASLRGSSDSETLFGLCRTFLGSKQGPEALGAALDQTLAALAALNGGAPPKIMASLWLSDGASIAVARWASPGTAAPSLHLAEGASGWGGGHLLASEPLDDDPAWRTVDPGQLVILSSAGATQAPLRASA